MKNKILRVLLSAVIAIALWAYVVTVVSPNSDAKIQNIPVTLQGELMLHDRSLMIAYADAYLKELQLEGNRVDLNKLSSSNVGIQVDVSNIAAAGTYSLPYTITYPGDVSQSAVNARSGEPGLITVTVVDRLSKEIPIEIQYEGTVAENFMADKENKTLDRTNLRIAGPKDVVEKITAAMITVDLEGKSESISQSFEIVLCDAEGAVVEDALITTDVTEVNLTLRIVRVKQIELTLNVVPGGGATAENTQITLDTSSIWISGSDALLEGIESLELGTVELGEIESDTTQTFPIKLPEGITCETGVTEVAVEIKFPELATKRLTIKEFTLVNVPEGMDAQLLTKALEVQFRGPENKLEKLDEKMLTAEVDFTGVETGTVKVKVTVTCTDPDIGAVGSYTVSATVAEKEAE